MANPTYSPHETAQHVLATISRRNRGRPLTESRLKELWEEVLPELEIEGQNIAWQWLRLRTSVRTIQKNQQRLYDAGNITQRQRDYRISQRVRASVVESARRVVITQSIDDEIRNGGESYARMLHTAADEPDLAHTMLEGKIMPLVEVLQELERFGCQHEYEIVSLRPPRATLGTGYGFESGLEDSIPLPQRRA